VRLEGRFWGAEPTRRFDCETALSAGQGIDQTEAESKRRTEAPLTAAVTLAYGFDVQHKIITMACLAALAGGCNLNKLTADSTADLLHAASPQVNTLEDLDFAESGIPASLLTMEAVWHESAHNQAVLIELVQGYAGYGFAFLEDHIERAELADDADQAEYWRARTKATYVRGRMWGFYLMNERQPIAGGVQAQSRAGIEPWRRYLQRFTSAEDVPALFWTANCWLSWVQQSLDDPSALLDVPFAVAMMDRARQLDPNYYHGGIHMFYGLYYASTPRELGGQPDASRREFEQAISMTNRRELIYMVEEARAYAVMVQDRALFRHLLEEVLAAGDINPEDRLTNQVAKRRAQRYLSQIDTLFSPDAAGDSASSAASTSSGSP
jgi:hypothetical protein